MIVYGDKPKDSSKQTSNKIRRGRGLLNKVINRLPVELHLPGYQYCGPGTKLAKRFARGDPGINPLDAACKEHDIAYSQNSENIEGRNVADRILAERAWKRVFAKDAGIGEKAAAWGVTNAMKIKSKLGMGFKKKRATPLSKIITHAKRSMIDSKDSGTVIKSALRGARSAVLKAGGKRNIKKPRVLPVPKKVGGILPFLIPVFAGLSAVGALAGGASGIAKAVNDSNAAKRKLEESKRHNEAMEAIALGKGLHLKPYKQGLGLCLKSRIQRAELKKKKIQKT